MKYILILFMFLILFNSCSLNKDSKFWNENTIKKKEINKKLSNTLIMSDSITTMTYKDYEIYINDHVKNSKYPDLNQ